MAPSAGSPTMRSSLQCARAGQALRHCRRAPAGPHSTGRSREWMSANMHSINCRHAPGLTATWRRWPRSAERCGGRAEKAWRTCVSLARADDGCWSLALASPAGPAPLLPGCAVMPCAAAVAPALACGWRLGRLLRGSSSPLGSSTRVSLAARSVCSVASPTSWYSTLLVR